MFIIFISFLRNVKFSQQIINQSETAIGKSKFSVEMYTQATCIPFHKSCPRLWSKRFLDLAWRMSVCTDSRKECIHLTKWHQYIFSVSLKFGACYMTGQCGQCIKKCYLIVLCTFLGIFFVFSSQNLCFCRFHFYKSET